MLQERLRVPLHRFELAAGLLIGRAGQELAGRPEDERERGTQLVAHVRQQQRLGAAPRLGRVLRGGEVVDQLQVLEAEHQRAQQQRAQARREGDRRDTEREQQESRRHARQRSAGEQEDDHRDEGAGQVAEIRRPHRRERGHPAHAGPTDDEEQEELVGQRDVRVEEDRRQAPSGARERVCGDQGSAPPSDAGCDVGRAPELPDDDDLRDRKATDRREPGEQQRSRRCIPQHDDDARDRDRPDREARGRLANEVLDALGFDFDFGNSPPAALVLQHAHLPRNGGS